MMAVSRDFFRGIDKSPRDGYIFLMEDVHVRECPGTGGGAAAPACLLRRTDARLNAGIGHEESERNAAGGEEHRLHCAVCGNQVTSDADSIVVNGSHDHICKNPGGVVFHVGCFSGAGGCLAVGGFTGEYTWFPGYAWCYVVCASCHVHLGWRYESVSDGFFGLILDRLARG